MIIQKQTLPRVTHELIFNICSLHPEKILRTFEILAICLYCTFRTFVQITKCGKFFFAVSYHIHPSSFTMTATKQQEQLKY